MSTLEFLKSVAIEVVDVDESTITAQTTFEELHFDSLAFVELQVSVIRAYQVKLDFEIFMSGQVTNMGQLAAYIDGIRAQSPVEAGSQP